MRRLVADAGGAHLDEGAHELALAVDANDLRHAQRHVHRVADMGADIHAGALGDVDQGDGVFLMYPEEGATRRLVGVYILLSRGLVDGLVARAVGGGALSGGLGGRFGLFYARAAVLLVRTAGAGSAQPRSRGRQHDVAFVGPAHGRDLAILQFDEALVLVGEAIDDQQVHAVRPRQEGYLVAAGGQGDLADARRRGIDIERRRRDVDRLVARGGVDDHLGGGLLLGQAKARHGREEDRERGAGISDFPGMSGLHGLNPCERAALRS